MSPSSVDESAHAKNGRRIPNLLDDDGNISEQYREVASFSNWGVYVDLYEFEGAFALHLGAVEECDDVYEELGPISLQEAADLAEDRLYNELSERGWHFDRRMGLQNLADDESFALPEDAEYKEFWRTEWNYSDVARIEVYRWKSDEGVRWLALDDTTRLSWGCT